MQDENEIFISYFRKLVDRLQLPVMHEANKGIRGWQHRHCQERPMQRTKAEGPWIRLQLPALALSNDPEIRFAVIDFTSK